MVEINKEVFDGMSPEQKQDVLFDTVQRLEVRQAGMDEKLDALLKSPWRMAIPPVSWKALGIFLLAMAAIIKGDLTSLGKLLGAIIGM